MESRSRISPIRITSGDSRNAAFMPVANESVSVPISRCPTMDFLCIVDELDRVLERQDVAAGVAVAVVDHRRERGRLARPCRADHQDQPVALHDQLLEHLGHAQALDIRHIGVDVAQHQRRLAALHEGVAAKAADTAVGQREIDLAGLLELLELLVAEDLPDRPFGVARARVDRLAGRSPSASSSRSAHRCRETRPPHGCLTMICRTCGISMCAMPSPLLCVFWSAPRWPTVRRPRKRASGMEWLSVQSGKTLPGPSSL
jgi:hypothetical protein